MILSIHQFEVRRLGSAEVIGVVAVEAVGAENAKIIAQTIIHDRTGIEPGDQVITYTTLVQGLGHAAGDDRRSRDRIRRRTGRWRDGIARMPPDERRAALAAILRATVPGRPAVLLHAGPSAGPASPAPPRLIPIRQRAVISDGAGESRVASPC